MSVKKMPRRTTRSRLEPAASSTSRRFSNVWRACARKSGPTIRPSGSKPPWPETKMNPPEITAKDERLSETQMPSTATPERSFTTPRPARPDRGSSRSRSRRGRRRHVDGASARQRLLAGRRDCERALSILGCAENGVLVACGVRLEKAADATLERMHRRADVDLATAGRPVQAEVRVEIEPQCRLAREDVQIVGARQTLPCPRDLDRADAAVLEVEDEDDRVLDVALGLLLSLRERDGRARRLDAHDVAGDGALQVEVVARAFEDVAAALRTLEEPRTRLGRSDVAPDEKADLLTRERFAKICEHLDCVPLVADGADRFARAPGGDDRRGVVERPRDGLLEVDAEAALEDGHRRLAVVERRRTDPDRVELGRLEERLPVAVHVRTVRPGSLSRAGLVDVRSEEHTSELQSHSDIVCRLLLEKKKNKQKTNSTNKRHNKNQQTTT